MGLRGIADNIGPGVDHKLEQHSLVEAGAADEKVIGGPFTAVILPPGLAQPFAVGFKSAGGEDAAFRHNPFLARQRGDKFAVAQLESLHRCVVADLHPHLLRAAVIGIDQRFAAAHKKGVGAGYVQGAGERRLKVNSVLAHPVAALR